MKAIEKAVILARGLGTRMRKADEAAKLSEAEARVAEQGVKALIPIDRPFLDYVLAALAEAGFRRVCLVIGPEHDELRNYYANIRASRLSIEFAIQEKPLGTADAVLAAEHFADGESVVVLNSDNYYPIESLRALREDVAGSGVAVFEREGLIAGGASGGVRSNIPPERIFKFAVVQLDERSRLVRIFEKPTEDELARVGEPVLVSMNLWRLAPPVYRACRSIKPSKRGELDLPEAVQYAIDELGEVFDAITFNSGVLDLSSRSDIVGVREGLAGVKVDL